MYPELRDAVSAALPEEYPWAEELHVFRELDSTNDHLKTLARQGAPHGTVLIADHQTGGHGRLGRTFQSPGGMGVYLSMLLRPECPAGQLMHLTCAVAVAMCDAVENAMGLRPGIKWTNDLVHGRRKLGGILTELGLSPQGTAEYAIVGIGINCGQRLEDFPPQIREIAGSLAMATGRQIPRADLAAAMMTALWQMDAGLLSGKDAMLRRYRQDCVTLGKEISLFRGDTVRHGLALDVDADGALLVRYPDGSLETVNSGEVSVRGMYGYL